MRSDEAGAAGHQEHAHAAHLDMGFLPGGMIEGCAAVAKADVFPLPPSGFVGLVDTIGQYVASVLERCGDLIRREKRTHVESWRRNLFPSQPSATKPADP